MAARLKAAGFPAADVQVLGPNPRKGNLVARYRGTGARKPILLLAHLDVVEARREDWSIDPFTFLEKDGYFYGRGTSDDKAMAARFVANLIRLKAEGFTPDRDLILALTADEEGGNFNGADWLLKNHRDLIDAEFAINEGGGGTMKDGQVPDQRGAGEREGLPGLPPRGEEPRRPQLAAGEGQRHLPPGGRARRASRRSSFPLELNEVTRTYFERSAAVQTRSEGRGRHARRRDSRRPTCRPRRGWPRVSPYYNSMMRTTCVATMLSGGHATNALPQTARRERELPHPARRPTRRRCTTRSCA